MVKKTTDTEALAHACPSTVPRNVGPPPITPRIPSSFQLGTIFAPLSGPQMPKPSVALWRPKPMISVTASPIWLAAAAWPIARPSPKLWTPIPIDDEKRESDRRVREIHRAPRGELVDRGRARPDEQRCPSVGARLHPRVVVDEAHQPADEADHAKNGELAEMTPMVVVQRLVDRVDGVRHHVPEEEDEDAGREGGEPRAGRSAEPVHARHGQAEKDRRAGDRAPVRAGCVRSTWFLAGTPRVRPPLHASQGAI